ncbi:hypothetical protein JDV09_18895 [Mycobacterium sp. Y57]|uniref:hypothetical protein n=1 Tax=Mycolicibacterium xanthum TaxID=2796469 RepID=UPI001C85D316|nr:hypothetical protein [Mycolicibacterium xanthum]MBX7434167.1 hypothetical protein [Mycolicibacterium xanthum]
MTRFPWGNGPAPALPCSHCGRTIAKRRGHLTFDGTVLLCGKCVEAPTPQAAHARHYPDCPHRWHDMWDHPVQFASRAAAWLILNDRTGNETSAGERPAGNRR